MALPIWKDLLASAEIEPEPATIDQLDRFLDLLIEWNEKLNLTRIATRPDADIKHVADALTLLPHLPSATRDRGRRRNTPLTLADLGTGGGVPGIPLAIARPDLRVTLIDATRKKLDALEHIVAALGLTNVRTLHSRIEAVEVRYDILTTRAVADLDTLLELTKALFKNGTRLLALKGPKAAEELELARPRLNRLRRTSRLHPVDRPELPGHCIIEVR
jgi:16S rRNA (guanine527-N7)-methyltransferase